MPGQREKKRQRSFAVVAFFCFVVSRSHHPTCEKAFVIFRFNTSIEIQTEQILNIAVDCLQYVWVEWRTSKNCSKIDVQDVLFRNIFIVETTTTKTVSRSSQKKNVPNHQNHRRWSPHKTARSHEIVPTLHAAPHVQYREGAEEILLH